MIRWEYEMLKGTATSQLAVVENLSRMGDEGWEVCGTLPDGYIILKRQKSQLAPDAKPEDDDFLGGRRGGGPG